MASSDYSLVLLISVNMFQCQITHAIILLLAIQISFIFCVSQEKCRVKLDLSVCSLKDPEHFRHTEECRGGAICSKTFSVAYMTHKPYSAEILIDLLRMCCGDCVNSSVMSNFTKVSHITNDLMNTSHFVFPVLGKQDARYMYGQRFLPLFETPSVYYITYKENNLIFGLIVSCLNMWPLFLVCALMVIISGFLCWAIEMRNNQGEFPRSFVSGLVEFLSP